MSKPIPPIFRTTNWRSYNTALRQRGSLSIWFDPETEWLAAPTGKRGRQPIFTDAAIQTCLTLKALFGLSSLMRHWFEPTDDASGYRHGSEPAGAGRAGLAGAGLQHALPPPEGHGCGHCRSSRHGGFAPPDRRRAGKRHRFKRTGEACCPSCWSRSPMTSPSARSVQTAPMTPGPAARGAIAVIPTRRNGRLWKEDTPGADARNDILRATNRRYSTACSIA